MGSFTDNYREVVERGENGWAPSVRAAAASLLRSCRPDDQVPWVPLGGSLMDALLGNDYDMVGLVPISSVTLSTLITFVLSLTLPIRTETRHRFHLVGLKGQ